LRRDDQHARFEQLIVPHLDAAYNLARWLTRRDQDAEDLVQEAYLRAFQFFGGFHGTDGRAWLLAIVRNTCYTWMQRNRPHAASTSFDEQTHGAVSEVLDPQAIMLRTEDAQLVRQALEELPDEFREVIVLRELEGLPYKDIAQIVAIPIGTVMSRLARARGRLQQILAPRMKKET
jgi:RNA polymerase sigma-70 factor (ECF subfamily)